MDDINALKAKLRAAIESMALQEQEPEPEVVGEAESIQAKLEAFMEVMTVRQEALEDRIVEIASQIQASMALALQQQEPEPEPEVMAYAESIQAKLEAFVEAMTIRQHTLEGQIGETASQIQTSMVPPYPNLKLPLYDGQDDPLLWLDRCEQFFGLQRTLEEDRVGLAGFHLTGEAQLWYYQFKKEAKDVNWKEFKLQCDIRFGPSVFYNPLGELANLKQQGSLEEYQRQFQKLLARTSDLKPIQQVGLFMAGLTEGLRFEMEFHRPENLDIAMNLARALEKKQTVVCRAQPIEQENEVEENLSNEDNRLFFLNKRVKSFDLDYLLNASAEVLGKGTLGSSYKVILEAGITVAVKRFRKVIASKEEFRQKMEEIAKMNHQNLVPLIAHFYNEDKKFVVREYLPLGSLSAHLHDYKLAGRTPLNWETRLAIALGAAQGIAYLHSLGPLVSHGNINSSNVLLTHKYEARLSDYCLANLVGLSSTQNRVAGYRAPELTDPQEVSQKADIHRFGVLLLELLTGEAPTQAATKNGVVDLPSWVQSIVEEEKWKFDRELMKNQNVMEDMFQLMQLAAACASPFPDHRPSMSQIINAIQELYDSSLLQRNFGIINDAEERQECFI